MIAWQIRTLIQIKDMLNKGLKDFEISDNLKIGRRYIRKYIEDLKKFSKKDLVSALSKILQLEILAKTTSSFSKFHIEKFIISM